MRGGKRARARRACTRTTSHQGALTRRRLVHARACHHGAWGTPGVGRSGPARTTARVDSNQSRSWQQSVPRSALGRTRERATRAGQHDSIELDWTRVAFSQRLLCSPRQRDPPTHHHSIPSHPAPGAARERDDPSLHAPRLPAPSPPRESFVSLRITSPLLATRPCFLVTVGEKKKTSIRPLHHHHKQRAPPLLRLVVFGRGSAASLWRRIGERENRENKHGQGHAWHWHGMTRRRCGTSSSLQYVSTSAVQYSSYPHASARRQDYGGTYDRLLETPAVPADACRCRGARRRGVARGARLQP
jgi:hypothetical protein